MGKGQICNDILRSLPNWFGIEKAIIHYTEVVEDMLVWGVESNAEPLGFIAIKQHFETSAEIYVMGIKPEYHRKGIGRSLIKEAENCLRLKGVRYLQVKTLSSSSDNYEYSLTRKFYLAMGFSPFEEFSELWGENNPCLQMIKAL